METAQEFLAGLKEKILRVETDNKIDRVKTQANVENALGLDDAEIYRLKDEERYNLAYSLAQYAFDLRRKENEYKACLNYIDSHMRDFVVEQAPTYFDDVKFIRYDEKYTKVVSNNDSLRKIEMARRELRMKLDTIDGMSDKAEKMSDRLSWKIYRS